MTSRIYRPATNLVHAGQVRSNFAENAEALGTKNRDAAKTAAAARARFICGLPKDVEKGAAKKRENYDLRPGLVSVRGSRISKRYCSRSAEDILAETYLKYKEGKEDVK